MHTSRLIEVTADRAYLEVWDELESSAPDHKRVVWCALSELPQEIAKELRSGKNPWAR
jgi:hypothetical protein